MKTLKLTIISVSLAMSTVAFAKNKDTAGDINPFAKMSAQEICDMETCEVLVKAKAFVRNKSDALKCIEYVHKSAKIEAQLIAASKEMNKAMQTKMNSQVNVANCWKELLYAVILDKKLDYTKILPKEVWGDYLKFKAKEGLN